MSNKKTRYESIINDVSDLSDFYFIIHLILLKLNKSNKFGLIPELSYLLDEESFTNLITYFEGETITIPTKEEVDYILKLIKLYYNVKVLNKPYDDSLVDAYGYTDESLVSKVSEDYLELLNTLSDTILPRGIHNEK